MLKFLTACEMSNRLRLDLVMNIFFVFIVFNNQIEILIDGSPWRPLLHVEDMSGAIEWGIPKDRSIASSYIAKYNF